MAELVDHRKTFKDRFLKTNLKEPTSKELLTQKPIIQFIKAVAYRVLRILGELTAIVLGLACLWFAMLSSLMARQSVDISELKPNAQMWFSEAFNGASAEIGDMSLRWLPTSNNIVFEAVDVLITDKKGALIESIQRLQTEIPMSSASKGILTPKRLLIQGGSVTWLRDNNGSIVAGLGTPNTVGKLGPIWRGKAENKGQQTNFLAIDSVLIDNATAYIIDDSDGLELTFESTDVELIQYSEGIEIDFQSSLKKDETKIPIDVNLKASSDFEDYTVNFVTEGLNPSVLSPKRGRYAGLKDFNADLNITTEFTIERELGLNVADIDIDMGAGTFKFGEFETSFNDGRFAATLSAETQKMDITDIGLTSEKLSFSGSGSLNELGAMTDGNIYSSPVFDLVFENVLLDRRPSFVSALQLPTLEVAGRLDLDARELELERMRANLGHYELNLNGKFVQNQSGAWEQILLNGQTRGILGPSDILAIWPVAFAEGARSWIKRSIIKASIDNLVFNADLGEDALRTGIPENEDLNLTFDVNDAEVKYISTMTPYTNVAGKGILRGNSVHFDAKGGNIGSLSVSTVVADIPRLQPKGGDLTIKINGAGSTAEMLSLIDQKPFEFPTQFGVQPEKFGGDGIVDVTITRPLLVFFDRDRIQYDINGTFSDVTAPIDFGGHELKNGRVVLTADKNGMAITGPVDIGPWHADLNWNKKFDFGKTPISYQVTGRMTRDTLDGFGIGFREYFDGDIDIKIDALGNGLDLTSADVEASLTDSFIQIGDYWRKEKGRAATFSGKLKRQVDGAIQFENMALKAPGLDIDGRISLANNLRLLDLDLPKAKVAGFIDASVQAKPDELNEKLSVFVTGEYLDLSPMIARMFESNSQTIKFPVLLTAGLNKLSLHEAYIVDGANLLLSQTDSGITNARFSGQMPEGPIKIQMRSLDDGEPRQIDVDIPDASKAAKAFLNLDSIEGGRLNIKAELPSIGQTGMVMGVAEIDQFKLLKAPILAQMLSIASLTGLVDTFSGEGLGFDTFHIPFALDDDTLNIRNARVSGPALGMTGDGEIRFKDRLVDLDGALVPAYTANSLLGDIPVFGDLLIGNKGEGVFALSYTVQGAFDEAQIAVNPLSALTPGFLRGIFKPKRNELSDETLAQIKSVNPN